MSRKMTEEFSEYNNNLCMRALSKENVKRVYFSSLLLALIGLAFLIISKISAITVINHGMYFVSAIFSLIYAGIFFLASKYIAKNRIKNAFKTLNIVFWCGIAMVALLFSLSASSQFGALVPFFISIAAVGIVPIFQKIESFIILGMQVIGMLISVVFDKISYTEIVYCMLFIVLSVGTSMIRFNNFKLSFRYKSKLNAAIRQSETDKLTGLLNRRGLERGIYELWEKWKVDKTNIAIIMIDIDFFKKYNDAFGHMEGDNCIQLVANEIKSAVRKNIDFAARVGGEEFLICLSDIEALDSVTWLKRLKENIENLRIKQASNNFLPYVTVSMGLVCTKPNNSVTFNDLYNMADQELYTAKESGRACFVFKGKVYSQKISSDYNTYAKVANFDNRF